MAAKLAKLRGAVARMFGLNGLALAELESADAGDEEASNFMAQVLAVGVGATELHIAMAPGAVAELGAETVVGFAFDMCQRDLAVVLVLVENAPPTKGAVAKARAAGAKRVRAFTADEVTVMAKLSAPPLFGAALLGEPLRPCKKASPFLKQLPAQDLQCRWADLRAGQTVAQRDAFGGPWTDVSYIVVANCPQ